MSAHVQGILWALLASFCFASMGVVLKLTHQQFDFHSVELVFWRMFPACLFLGALAFRGKKRFATKYASRHLGRSLSGVVSMMLYFYAVSQLPLSVAVSISYSSSIFLALWSLGLKGERLGLGQQSALILGLLGVVILLQPEYSGQSLWGMMAAVLSAVLAGLAYFQLRELGQLGEPAWRTVFYMSLVGTIVSAVLTSFWGWHDVSQEAWFYVLGISTLALIGQMALTEAYAIGRKETISVLSYITVVVASFWSYWYFGEILVGVQYGGIWLIVISGMISALAKK